MAFLSYDEISKLALEYYQGTTMAETISQYGLNFPGAYKALSEMPNLVVDKANGKLLVWKAQKYTKNVNTFTGTVEGSTTLSIPTDMSVNTSTGKLAAKAGVTKVATGTTVKAVASTVATSIALTGAGIALGKKIAPLLYEAFPNFWDSQGISNFDPETWNSLTWDDDSLRARVINVIFGLDPDTEGITMYTPTEILVMATKYLFEKGAYETKTSVDEATAIEKGLADTITHSIPASTQTFVLRNNATAGVQKIVYRATNDAKIALVVFSQFAHPAFRLIASGSSPFVIEEVYEGEVLQTLNSNRVSLFGNTFNSIVVNVSGGDPIEGYGSTALRFNRDLTNLENDTIKWILRYGTSTHSTIDGITDQSGSTQVSIDDDDTLDDIRDKLETTYPDMFGDAIQVTTLQEDDTLTTQEYVPIPTPWIDSRTDLNPTSGNEQQGNPEVDPDSDPQTKESIERIINDPNPNTPDTGDGSSPTTPVPTGTASALYTVYAPTQAQLNSFGAWLWSTNFVDQLLKVFNDPMQAIIGLHKCYCPVPTGASAPIKVGYLNSGVESLTVSSQYTSVSCGSVNCFEYFGNVFDYDPFTKVHLFLPFIGIVPLNTADVMRGTVSVKYNFDVLTGACLAEVSVTRDLGAGGVLYTYSGNCACQYPLSSGSYMGIVSGILGIAGGVAASVASGGALAPVAIGAANAALNMHTNIQHSGSISGNAGVMGGKTPYLIISRPQTQLAESFETLQGKPANEYTTLAQCSGYVVVDSVHVEGITATDAELSQIESLLKSGVIV